jgi:hypothetical protein
MTLEVQKKIMTLEQLKRYENWVGKSAKDVLEAARIAGGWANVFPDKIPIWAHRVRNYFNREPKSLSRFDESRSKKLVAQTEGAVRARNIAKMNAWNLTKPSEAQIAETFALSDDVYKDANNWIWYQMSPGGAVYHLQRSHLRETIMPSAIEAGYQTLKGQAGVSIFKLIAPDGTGGSRETIMRNINHWSTVVKSTNQLSFVGHLVVTDYWYQGSYNYSETVKAGYSAHVMRDVTPHSKYPFPDVYLNPPDRHSSLAERIFPERVNNEPNPLAKQI